MKRYMGICLIHNNLKHNRLVPLRSTFVKARYNLMELKTYFIPIETSNNYLLLQNNSATPVRLIGALLFNEVVLPQMFNYFKSDVHSFWEDSEITSPKFKSLIIPINSNLRFSLKDIYSLFTLKWPWHFDWNRFPPVEYLIRSHVWKLVYNLDRR